MRILKEVFLNFKRSGFMGFISIGTISITIAMLGGYYVIKSSVDKLITDFTSNVKIQVFLLPESARDEKERVMEVLKSYPFVKSSELITKEEALASYEKDADMMQIIKSFGENPLPDSISITLHDYSVQNIKTITDAISGLPGVEEVVYGGDDINNLLNIARVIRMIAGIAGLIFAIASVMVVMNIIKLTMYNRRQDIYVFRMVGAGSMYIRMPFIMEGIIYGFIGGLIGWAALYTVAKIILLQIKKETGINLSEFVVFDESFLTAHLLFLSASAGTVLGLAGALFSQWRMFK